MKKYNIQLALLHLPWVGSSFLFTNFLKPSAIIGGPLSNQIRRFTTTDVKDKRCPLSEVRMPKIVDLYLALYNAVQAAG